MNAESNLRDHRLSLWNEAKALAEHVASQDRCMTVVEQAEWDRLCAALEMISRRIALVTGQRLPGSFGTKNVYLYVRDLVPEELLT